MRPTVVPLIIYWLVPSLCLSIDVFSNSSICAAAQAIVQGELNYYLGLHYGGTVGMFVPPYYWWHAGEVFGGWVDYWAFCAHDNATFTSILFDAMYAQRGSDNNYMPLNQSMTEGNDDQGVWGMTLMQAVERNFTNPSEHSWLYLTQAVFNSMNNRWDTATCNGGLRWQIFTWNNGYDYKNSIANGCLFHLAARLYRFTGEEFYLEIAEKVYQWMWDVGFFAADRNGLVIYDGATDTNNCTDLTVHRWSYTYGIFMAGGAYLYNATEDEVWHNFTSQIVAVSGYFFANLIMTETTCAANNLCDNDQRSFRLLFSRCLGLTAVLMPQVYSHIVYGWLQPSARAAAQLCSGGSDGVTCGQNWGVAGWDGVYGLGEQMCALECVLSLMAVSHDPLTPQTGGSSVGSDISAGNSTRDTTNTNEFKVTAKDKAGAAVLTVLVLGGILAGLVWMLM